MQNYGFVGAKKDHALLSLTVQIQFSSVIFVPLFECANNNFHKFQCRQSNIQLQN